MPVRRVGFGKARKNGSHSSVRTLEFKGLGLSRKLWVELHFQAWRPTGGAKSAFVNQVLPTSWWFWFRSRMTMPYNNGITKTYWPTSCPEHWSVYTLMSLYIQTVLIPALNSITYISNPCHMHWFPVVEHIIVTWHTWLWVWTLQVRYCLILSHQTWLSGSCTSAYHSWRWMHFGRCVWEYDWLTRA